MCRNIKILFNFDPPVTAEEIRAASLQFVRKISGFNKPSKANEEAFLAAVDVIAAGAQIHRFVLVRGPGECAVDEYLGVLHLGIQLDFTRVGMRVVTAV